MKTSTSTYYPILTALSEAINFTKETLVSSEWNVSSDRQKDFLEKFHKNTSEANSIKDIQTKASKEVKVLNSFLKEKGFNIQLDTFQTPDDFGIVSIMDVLVSWIESGKETNLVVKGNNYKAVSMKEDVSILESKLYSYPIAEIETKEGDSVFITIADQEYSGDNLVTKCIELEKSSKHKLSDSYNGLVFPKVSLDKEEDISFLKEMFLRNKDGSIFKIAQALQQTKFRMNEKGARAESAVAISMMLCRSTRGPSKPPMIVDKPFLVWISRKNMSLPLFAGLIAEDCWKDPGSLE